MKCMERRRYEQEKKGNGQVYETLTCDGISAGQSSLFRNQHFVCSVGNGS